MPRAIVPAEAPPWAAAQALGTTAPEFAGYQDEPPQMGSAMPGKTGYLKLHFERRGDRSILADLDRRAPFMAQRALYCDAGLPALPHVYLITTSGCLLQGDRLALDVSLGAQAQAHVTTQAATKIHAMDANYAAQTQSFTLADGAYLEYLPDPVIPHRRSRFISDTRMAVAPTATLLYAEVLHCGRKHHHREESFGFTVYDARIAATRPDGTELFTERLLIEPARRDPRDTGVMGPFDVLGNAVLLTPAECAERVLAALPAGVDMAAGLAFGACRLPNNAGVIYKVLGIESAPVRARLREFWSLAREAVLGVAAPPVDSWR